MKKTRNTPKTLMKKTRKHSGKNPNEIKYRRQLAERVGLTPPNFNWLKTVVYVDDFRNIC